MKLLAVTTHPIQYQTPWFRALASNPAVDLAVLFATVPDDRSQGSGFDKAFQWDIPLLDGYRWRRAELVGRRPSLDRFLGLRAKGLAEIVRQENPDVVLLTGWNSYFLLQALEAARQEKVPCIVRGDSNALRSRSSVVRRVHRWLLRRYSAFLVVGRSNRAFLANNGVPDFRQFEVPHFVDNQRFAQQSSALEEARQDLRSLWTIPGAAVCFLFAGKLIHKKRPGDLIEAAARVRRGGVDLHLLFAGSGELQQDLEIRCRDLGVPATFAGFLNQTEIAKAYVASDLLVLPSDSGETWGLVVNEAMASGRPVIVSDLVGCREDLIDEGQTGWSYPCGDVDRLAALLESAIDQRERLRAMGGTARRAVVEGYSIELAVEGTLRACEFVLREGRT